jgi:hypothetical protein
MKVKRPYGTIRAADNALVKALTADMRMLTARSLQGADVTEALVVCRRRMNEVLRMKVETLMHKRQLNG